MPIYVYRAVEGGCEHCRDGFELLQASDDPPPKKCPRCGCKVEKVPASFRTGKGSVLTNRSLKDHGFSKLRRTDEGGYEKEV